MTYRGWIAWFAVCGLTAPLTAEGRPERAPSVDVVAKVLGVGRLPGPPLDAHGHAVAHAAGKRLVSLCPDCRLSTIDEEGPCGWARAQRAVIRNAVAAGHDEEAIVAAYVRSYGKEVLTVDKSQGFAAASWAVPVLVVFMSLGLVFAVGRRMMHSDAGASATVAQSISDIEQPHASKDVVDTLKAELDALD